MAATLICARPTCANLVPPKPSSKPGTQPRYCSRRCQKRAWDAVPATCPRCGGPRWRSHDGNCRACEFELRHQASKARDEDIVLMWEEGMSQVAINAALGYAPGSTPPELSRLMREGRITARREGVRRKHEQRVA